MVRPETQFKWIVIAFIVTCLMSWSWFCSGQVLLTDAVIQGASFSGTGGTPSPPAGIAFVQQAGTNYASTSSATVVVNTTNAVSAGNCLVAMVYRNDTAALTSIADNRTNTWTFVTNGLQAGAVRLSCYVATNCAAGVTGVTASWATACAWNSMQIVEYSGVALASPLDAYSQNSADSSGAGAVITAGTNSASATGELAICGFNANSGPLTAWGSYTQRTTDSFISYFDLVLTNSGSIAGNCYDATGSDPNIGLALVLKHQ